MRGIGKDHLNHKTLRVFGTGLQPAGIRNGTGMFLGLLRYYGYGTRAASGVVLLLCLLVLVSFLFCLCCMRDQDLRKNKVRGACLEETTSYSQPP